MTWHAPRGSIVLSGSEAKLFAEAIDDIISQIQIANCDENSELCYGPASFNRLTRTQQAASLDRVAHALFNETIEPFPLVAWSEATLAAILGCMRAAIDYEIDTGESSEVRDEIDRLTDFDASPKKKDWDSHKEWELPLDCYESQFLWDYDFAHENLADLEPDASELVGSTLGIDSDYHPTIPPDLRSDQDLAGCLKRTTDLVRKYY